MKTFSLFGAAGYVAPRHIRSIYELGHELISVFDPVDAGHQVRSLFPNALIFTDFTAFEQAFLDRPTDYISICSPNHLHFEQIAWALRNGADVICEKPLVLDPKELDLLSDLEKQTGKSVFTVLQMRLMDVLVDLQSSIDSTSGGMHDVSIQYITPRKEAFFSSWKGKPEQSGGILTNIGIHLFDLLIWIFGPVISMEISVNEPQKAKGRIELESANVDWFLSVDEKDLPISHYGFYRKLSIDGVELSLETGLENLHTRVYKQVLAGKAPGIQEARFSIQFCNTLVNSKL